MYSLIFQREDMLNLWLNFNERIKILYIFALVYLPYQIKIGFSYFRQKMCSKVHVTIPRLLNKKSLTRYIRIGDSVHNK